MLFETHKTLILYFSLTGNTKQLAECISTVIGAQLCCIEPKTPYPLVQQDAIDEMSRQNKNKILPPFKKPDRELYFYDVFFLGYPVWDMRLPPVMRTFLRDTNFSGKTLIPFNTHAGYGTGKSVNEINGFVQKTEILEVFSVRDSMVKNVKADVIKWIDQIRK